MTLFTVKDGEIVGKTDTGIKQNEFLKSRLSVGDFRLVCKIKLVPNEANSGIQFRSVPHNGNEMAGSQADAGKGWWGKTLRRKPSATKSSAKTSPAKQVVKTQRVEHLRSPRRRHQSPHRHQRPPLRGRKHPQPPQNRHLRPAGPRRGTDGSAVQGFGIGVGSEV